MLDIPTGMQTPAHAARIRSALHELGWQKKLARFGGEHPEQAYVKGSAKFPQRIVVERSSTGYCGVCYEGQQREPEPF